MKYVATVYLTLLSLGTHIEREYEKEYEITSDTIDTIRYE